MASQAPSGMKRFYLFLGLVAVVGLGALAYLTLRRTTVSIPANVAVVAADTAGFRGYLLGSDSATIEVTEYADYQCPACATFETVQFPDVKDRLIQTGRVRWRYRDFPINGHLNARIAAHTAACANDQGRFWEMHRFLYEGQPDWEFAGNPMGDFESYARSARLDMSAFGACMKSAKYAGRIEASAQEGLKVGVNSTPTFLIGGRLYPGVMPYDAMRKLVDSLAGKPKS